ncbi:MAG: TRAP transporter small permease [Clostridia bacterium]|nr:TRAP transporter small permease [Clostridia bacterium]
MKKMYRAFCSLEELLCGGILCGIVALAFATAVGRCINRPLSWTVEVSQFLLAWLAFLGADMALRHGRVTGVDLLTRKLPQKGQAAVKLITDLLILALLIAFVRFGYALCVSNLKRSYQTVGISYAWATAACPVSSLLMIVTILMECWQQLCILLGKSTKEG